MEKLTLLTRLGQLYPQARKTTLRDMVAGHRVRLNGVVVRSLKQAITPADKLDVAEEATRQATVLNEGLRLIHFDADIILVEKPAGLLTSTDAQERRPTAWRILQDYFRKQNHKNDVHLVHRLDQAASGLLVFARNWDAYGSLKRQFFEHTITRQYDVIVHGIPVPAKGRLEHLLLENEQGFVHITANQKQGQQAILDYHTIRADQTRNLAHLRCTLFTGRKHQIRVQLKAIGHAVCGDGVYGKAEEPPHRLALHAARLSFEHPRTGKIVSFESPMPGALAHLFRA